MSNWPVEFTVRVTEEHVQRALFLLENRNRSTACNCPLTLAVVELFSLTNSGAWEEIVLEGHIGVTTNRDATIIQRGVRNNDYRLYRHDGQEIVRWFDTNLQYPRKNWTKEVKLPVSVRFFDSKTRDKWGG